MSKFFNSTSANVKRCVIALAAAALTPLSLADQAAAKPPTPTLTTILAATPSTAQNPSGPLLRSASGVLYGTSASTNSNAGTVFSLTPPASAGGAWSYSLLYQFSGPDGALPNGALIADANGVLYGVTAFGGAYDQGTVFSLTPPAAPGGPWTQRVLYSFQGVVFGRDDGFSPDYALVLDASGNLYGTTEDGTLDLKAYWGTVFELIAPTGQQKSWKKVTLHQFQLTDGALPSQVFLDQSGSLIGSATYNQYYTGLIFRLAKPSSPKGKWTEQILYSFPQSSSTNTRWPGPIVAGKSGVLYGITQLGGTAGSNGLSSVGLAFSLSPPAKGQTQYTYKTIFDFGTLPNTSTPALYANTNLLIDHAGALYGVASGGGSTCDVAVFMFEEPLGCGVVFKLTPPKGTAADWKGQALAVFNGDNGRDPFGGLIADTAGNLYGVTSEGGASDADCEFATTLPTNGCGLIYELTGSGFKP